MSHGAALERPKGGRQPGRGAGVRHGAVLGRRRAPRAGVSRRYRHRPSRIIRSGSGYVPPMASTDRPATASAPRVRVPADVALDLRFDADRLQALRAALASCAEELGAGPVAVEALVIVASELATNAVRHGGGTGRARLWRDGAVLRCQITDRGPGLADVERGRTPPGRLAIGGRGLWISRRLAAELVIDVTGPGTAITATIPLA